MSINLMNNMSSIMIDDIRRVQNNFLSEDFINDLERDLRENALNYFKKDHFNVSSILKKGDSNDVKHIIQSINLINYIYNICFCLYVSSKIRKIVIIESKPVILNSDIADYILKDKCKLPEIEKGTDLVDFLKDNESNNFFKRILNQSVISNETFKDIAVINLTKSISHILKNKGYHDHDNMTNKIVKRIYRDINNKKLSELIDECGTDFLKSVCVIKNNHYDNNLSIFKSKKLNIKYSLMYNEVRDMLYSIKDRDGFNLSIKFDPQMNNTCSFNIDNKVDFTNNNVDEQLFHIVDCISTSVNTIKIEKSVFFDVINGDTMYRLMDKEKYGVSVSDFGSINRENKIFILGGSFLESYKHE